MSTRGDRLADDLVILRRFFLHRLLWVELDREALAADQFGVADLLAAAGHDDAVGNGEVIGAELLGGFRKQRLPRGGGGLPQLHTANLDGNAAQVLPWSGVSKVSPCTNSMRFNGTSSSSATIWRRAVVMPVPRSTLPE